MNDTPHIPNDNAGATPPPRDELDALLRDWHAENSHKASAGRDRLLSALAKEDASEPAVLARIEPKPEPAETLRADRPLAVIRRIIVNRYAPLAAAAIALAALLPFVLSGKSGLVSNSNAQISNIVMAPEGGRLDAFDKQGNALGPCALKHTDVSAEISGRFTRVTVVQKYHNPNPDKIEAVYTFPLSDRAGVDRMTMTIGDRVIEGEVKERQQARRIYEQAKASNRVASLLEQERPNIFTQSIANIEPGATIDISISYVEMVAEHDGEFSFAFPTVVSPRYIPGNGQYDPDKRPLPLNTHVRRGLVLSAPATISKPKLQETSAGERSSDELRRMLAAATPIDPPAGDSDLPGVWYQATAAYPDGSAEPAVLLVDGRGNVGGRWFYCPPTPPMDPAAPPGSNFAQPTNQVPDADRITPMPTRPDVRAGHDLSVSVTIDTGGPGITFLDSPQHKVARTDLAKNALDQARRVSLSLANLSEIPNRDFVLKWKTTSDAISSRLFTHTGDTGNFFTVQLDPPAQSVDARAVPRELVFVVDTSGSMNGRPIAMCKEVMRKAIDQMRPQDTFNIITFAGATRIMWDRPRPNTPENRTEAQRFVDTWQGQGGTEMMTAIEAALRQAPAAGMGGVLSASQLADLPADGRQVAVEASDAEFRSEGLSKDAVTDRAELFIRDDLSIKCAPFQLPQAYLKRAARTNQDESVTLKLLLRGAWTTVNGERLFQVSSAALSGDSSVRPLRLVMFLTDAEVGNDFAIIDAIKRNRDTTRVFSFGIGSSVNRYLIEQMALAGGGEPEFIYANSATDEQAAAAVDRFNRRTKTPILTDIRVTFNGVQPLDVLPEPAAVQDLWDNRPLTFMGRYVAPGAGSLTIKGQTALGPWERTIPLEFPAKQRENSSLPTLWARAKIDALIGSDLLGTQRGQPNPDVRAKVVTLGETFNVMSQYTSFVAVDKLRVTVDGQPRLVHVPVELPDQTNWEGFFGEISSKSDDDGKLRASTGDASRGLTAPEHFGFKQAALNELVAINDELAKKRELVREEAGRKLEDAVINYAVTASVTPTPSSAGPAGGKAPGRAGDDTSDKGISPPAPTVATSPTPAAAAPPAPGAPASASHAAARGGAPAVTPPAPPPTAAPPATTDAARKQTPGPVLAAVPTGRPTPDAKPQEAAAPAKTQEAPKNAAPSALATNTPRLTEYPSSPNAEFSIVERQPPAMDGSAATVSLGLLSEAEKKRGELETRLMQHPGRRVQGLSASARSSTDGDSTGADAYARDQSETRAFFYRERLGNYFGDLPLSSAWKEIPQLVLAGGRQDSLPSDLLTIAAAQLVEAGRVDDAKRLLCPNLPTGTGKLAKNDAAAGSPEQPPAAPSDSRAAQLCDKLASGTDTERLAFARTLRVAAATDLLARRRADLVARKIAPDIQIMITAARGERDKSAAHPITVTMLLSNTSEETIKALKAQGLTVLSVKPEASVIVARASPSVLEELAALDVVRRVELIPEPEATETK